jgi:D-beta-D-heptose 7-phosphate kinase/D-beta-D-heptose 1-phosphate adenosyltransferase
MNELKNTQPQTLFNVLLIGDSCIDEYFIGTCDRLSPEAPVPVMKINNYYTTQGMAANVKNNFARLGIEVDFITNDSTITKTRYIDQRSGQHLLRVDNEPQFSEWSGRTARPLTDYDIIVISDYDKGFITYEQIEIIVKECSCPIFIDTKKTNLARFEGAFVKINNKEYGLAKTFCSNIITTMGDQGARYNGKIYPVPKVGLVDVCGAGDTFLAALVYQYLMTSSIEEAIMFANQAGAISVQHQGNYAPSLEEINGH